MRAVLGRPDGGVVQGLAAPEEDQLPPATEPSDEAAMRAAVFLAQQGELGKVTRRMTGSGLKSIVHAWVRR